MKKLLALLLALAMVLSMAACGGDGEGKKSKKDDSTDTTTAPAAVTDDNKNDAPVAEKAPVVETPATDAEAIIGKWSTTFDLSDALSETINALVGIDLAPDAALNLSLSFKFEANDKVEMSFVVDQASLTNYMTKMCENMLTYLYGAAEEAGQSKEDLDAEVLAETGMTTAEYVAAMMEQTMDSMLDSMSATEEQLYKLDTENKTIHFGEDQAELDSEKQVMTYKLSGNTLTITAITSDGEDSSAGFAMYGMELPWTLKKQ